MDVKEYINSGSRGIQGWMTRDTANLVRVVSCSQLRDGIEGSIGEIGVHHGRLFILLLLLAGDNERAFAIDVFEQQELNVDQSGQGDRAIFESNLRDVGADFGRIHIITCSSLEVTADDLLKMVGPARLFSIDGGHTTKIALNDLYLAEASLADGGVVILDDAFTSIFPGVSAGLAEYLLGDATLVPFVVSPEKVLLTQAKHHDRLMKAVADGLPDVALRYELFYGAKVLILRPRPTKREQFRLRVGRFPCYRRLRKTPIIGTMTEYLRPYVIRLVGR